MTFTFNQALTLTSTPNMTLNTTFTTTTTTTEATHCLVGEIAHQNPADLSIFQNFEAPSQPPDLPPWEIGLKIVFYVLAFLLSLCGNTLVILVICVNKRMRSTTNILLLNQAVSDVMVAVMCMWVHLGNSITPEWPFGPVVCKVNTFCQVVAVTSSVLTLTAISVERFTAIVFPLRARWTGCTCVVIITVTWLTALAVASPHLFVRHMYQQRWKDRHEVWCAEEWPQVYKDEDCNTWEPGKIVYYSIEGIVMYFVPVFIMIVAYSVISVTLITRKIPGILINSTISAQEKAKRKVIRMLVAVLVCFVLCWTPQQFMLVYDLFRPYDQVPLYVNTVKYVALYVAYLNSALNPILYGGFNDNFRRGFRDLLHCIMARKNNKVHPGNKGT
ncbi:neuropeptide FF receptor 2-like [Littorina saxatilis]|uniref:neuropeptide FF receptor 2-like n=1 Tax=Littorina saxatilis TaxID=31220 RepID=UPI0038B55F6D